MHRGANDEQKIIKEKGRKKHSREESGRRFFHIHLLSSSGLFRWQGRKIAAGVLDLSFSCPSPHSIFLSSFTLYFLGFSVQFVMYRDGFSLRL